MKVNGAKQPEIEFYEFLQISRNAQPATIQRVYRFLASYYHPDNPKTGDREKFVLLNHAYAVLSDTRRRAEYDRSLAEKESEPQAQFGAVDFLDGVEGELNRRLAVLAVLYRRCRTNIHDATLSLLELERMMGFPREYLDFTTWYLKNKNLITRADNSDFALTPAGVDFVEENYSKLPLLQRLLREGVSPDSSDEDEESAMRQDFVQAALPPASGEGASE